MQKCLRPKMCNALLEDRLADMGRGMTQAHWDCFATHIISLAQWEYLVSDQDRVMLYRLANRRNFFPCLLVCRKWWPLPIPGCESERRRGWAEAIPGREAREWWNCTRSRMLSAVLRASGSCLDSALGPPARSCDIVWSIGPPRPDLQKVWEFWQKVVVRGCPWDPKSENGWPWRGGCRWMSVGIENDENWQKKLCPWMSVGHKNNIRNW